MGEAVIFPRDYKIDKRPQRGMWAPGNYSCICKICGDRFMGDKRALQCADCAYGVAVTA
jgi:hypothetical protein